MKMLAILIAAMLLAACQNHIQIKVDRVLLENTDAKNLNTYCLQPDSHYGVAVMNAVNALELCKTWQERIKSQPPVVTPKTSETPMKADSDRLDSDVENCLLKMKGFFTIDVTYKKGEIATTLIESAQIVHRLRTLANRSQLSAADKQVIDRLDQSAEVNFLSNVGFGGFSSVGIYEINPSDRAYQYILDEKAADHSFEPITEARVSAAGDASVMLVMEKPGQVRVYQVSNDPTKLMQNVALIVQKAAAATAKFAIGMP